MLLRALVSADSVIFPSSSFESLSVSCGRDVCFKHFLRFVSDSGLSLLLYDIFVVFFSFFLKCHFYQLICVLMYQTFKRFYLRTCYEPQIIRLLIVQFKS